VVGLSFQGVGVQLKTRTDDRRIPIMPRKIDRILARVEQVLLFLCLGLFVFVIIYVYGFNAIRGPLANKEYYELGEFNKEAAQNEIRSEEGAGKTTIPQEEGRESDNEVRRNIPPVESNVEQE